MSRESPVAVSVVVVSFNAGDRLDRCLRSVLEQGVERLEVILVDNASSDESVEIVRRNFPSCRVVTNTTNRLFAPAANQGAALARGSKLLFLNSDAVLAPGTLTALLQELPHACDVVVPQLLAEDGRPQREYTYRRLPSAGSLVGELVFWNHLTRLVGGSHQVPTAEGDGPCVVVEQPSAACFLIDRHLFNSLGAFDERLALWFNDVDLAKRLREAGIAIHCRKEVKVHHVGGHSVKRLSAVDRARFLYSDLLAYAGKWHHRWLLLFRVLVAANLVVRVICDVWRPTRFLAWLRAAPLLVRVIAG